MNRIDRTLRLIYSSFPGKTIPFAILLVLSYCLWATFVDYDPIHEKLISSVLLLALSAILIAVAIGIARREEIHPQVRRAWLFLGLAFISNFVAESIWLYYETIRQERPSLISDLFYLMFYPLMLAGILRFPLAGKGKHSKIIMFFDLAIVMCTGFMALWYFVLTPLGLKPLEQIEHILIIYYPVAGSFILGAIVALTHRDLTKITWRVLFFLGLGMFCYLAADSILAYVAVNRIPFSEVPLNVLWMSGLLFFIVSACLQTVSASLVTEDSVIQGSLRMFLQQSLPYAATVIGAALLVVSIQNRAFSLLRLEGILIGIIALIGLVLVRQHRLLQENIKLYEQMQRIAVTDSLTGIHNRYFVMETLRMEIQRAKRYSQPLSILMIDLDRFKDFNDQHGHLEGDKALRQIAQALMTVVRSSDVLGRYGGDEFIAILAMTNFSGAQVVAEKMQGIVDQLNIHGTTLSLSVGIASLKGDIGVEELLDRADQDLYLHKHERRLIQSHLPDSTNFTK